MFGKRIADKNRQHEAGDVDRDCPKGIDKHIHGIGPFSELPELFDKIIKSHKLIFVFKIVPIHERKGNGFYVDIKPENHKMKHRNKKQRENKKVALQIFMRLFQSLLFSGIRHCASPPNPYNSFSSLRSF